jgi:hypothetical protein
LNHDTSRLLNSRVQLSSGLGTPSPPLLYVLKEVQYVSRLFKIGEFLLFKDKDRVMNTRAEKLLVSIFAD